MHQYNNNNNKAKLPKYQVTVIQNFKNFSEFHAMTNFKILQLFSKIEQKEKPTYFILNNRKIPFSTRNIIHN